jgi:hypothetical protein
MASLSSSSNKFLQLLKSCNFRSDYLYLGDTREVRTKFWSENLQGRNHSKDLGIDMRILLKQILIVLFVLFNGAISSSDYLASNGRMVNE